MNTQKTSSITTYLIAAIAVGALILIGLDLTSTLPLLRDLTTQFYRWLLLLGAVALLLGVISVAWVHVRRIQRGLPEWHNSLVLVVAMAAVVIAGMASPAGHRAPIVELLFNSVILPGQATLFALLAFFMAAAAFRYLRIGRSGGGWMLAGALIMFLMQVPMLSDIWPNVLVDSAFWLLNVPVMAATRGAILGGSLALLVASISFLLRQE